MDQQVTDIIAHCFKNVYMNSHFYGFSLVNSKILTNHSHFSMLVASAILQMRQTQYLIRRSHYFLLLADALMYYYLETEMFLH